MSNEHGHTEDARLNREVREIKRDGGQQERHMLRKLMNGVSRDLSAANIVLRK